MEYAGSYTVLVCKNKRASAKTLKNEKGAAAEKSIHADSLQLNEIWRSEPEPIINAKQPQCAFFNGSP